MKKIDLDSMSEAELRELNREIVRRLELYSHTRRKIQLMSFHVGDRVEFDDGYQIVSGVVPGLTRRQLLSRLMMAVVGEWLQAFCEGWVDLAMSQRLRLIYFNFRPTPGKIPNSRLLSKS